MPYVVGAILLLAVLYGISVYQQRSYVRKNRYRLLTQWGKISTEKYSQEKFLALRAYYDQTPKSDLDVDDITWNDLNMDELFMVLNHTESAIGEEYLYALLRRPVADEEILKERNRLIAFFASHEEERIKVQSALAVMGKLGNMSIYEYINRTDKLEKKSSVEHYIFSIGLLGALLLIFFQAQVGLLLSGILVINNIYRYYKQKKDVENYFQVFSYILSILFYIEEIAKMNIAPIQEYTDELRRISGNFKKFKRGSFILESGKNMGGSLLDSLLDYERMLFHSDLIKFNSMLQEIRDKKQDLNRIFEILGLLDAMIAVASFRKMIGLYALPELIPYKKGEKKIWEADDLYHPLIENPVVNSIAVSGPVLLTGSNASGKSTFLKTVAVNAILAQTIYTALCTKYRANYFRIYSSMALRDNIMEKESYFIVEIKSLKRMMERITEDIPMLCFVDEVLRGTNTLERIASSSMILAGIAEAGALCFAATHDLELTHILEGCYRNFHFSEQVEEGDILFDYKLHEGRAVSRNAIKLLELFGYEKSIVEKAQAMTDRFLETGLWSME